MVNMMREVGREIKVRKTVDEIETGVKEEIVSINHQVQTKSIEINTVVFSSDNRALKNETTFVSGEDYNNLISDSNLLLTDEKVIWSAIDKSRNSQ